MAVTISSSFNLLLLLVCSLICCSLSSAASTSEGSKKSSHGSPVASDRLMKELQRVYKSECYKKGLYTVDLVDESLYEWRVQLSAAMFDADSRLHKALVDMGNRGEKDKVELSFKFKDSYPFSPPFVRIIYPVVTSEVGGGIFGGVICMDIFTPQVSFLDIFAIV